MKCTIYGIRNCDTMKRAMGWLAQRNVAYVFLDYKTSGISQQQLARWSAAVGWETLLNRRGTTWRALALEREVTQRQALELMATHVTLIKRPVLVCGEAILVGFDAQAYSQLFDQ